MKPTGRQPTRSEQLSGHFSKLVVKDEWMKAIVHHVTEDSPHRLQLEVEFVSLLDGQRYFRRIVL